MNWLALEVLKAGALELRRVPDQVTNEEVDSLPLEEQPFFYSSGNWGLGYVMIKGLVGRKKLMRDLCRYLALEIVDKWPTDIDFVAGNVTGGMIPGWLVSEELGKILDKEIPFVYIRDSRKKGGHKELITGYQNNPEIPSGACGLNVEELVNFAETICNGVGILREADFFCNKGACILSYNNPVANKELAANGDFRRNLLASRPIFADTKTWNGKRTMTKIAEMLVEAEVDYFNVWVQADNQILGAIEATKGSETKVLGVTSLTHYNSKWYEMYFRRSLEETVLFLTQRAEELGCHGVVLPGTCLNVVKDSGLIKVVPGIRTEDYQDDRHDQEVTPEFAALNGADAIVCGSPIMNASSKSAALCEILSRLQI